MRVTKAIVVTTVALAMALAATPGKAAAADLGTFTLGDAISMPKDCDTNTFAHVHVVSGHHPTWAKPDPQIVEFDISAATNPYSYATATQGIGEFTVVIDCDPTEFHDDPTSASFNYTFTVVAAPAPTTTTSPTTTTTGATTTSTIATVLPAAGSSSTTTSIILIAGLTVLVGSGLLLVRRRSPA
jgi:LPXTG-motif cell wall-anchored protein